MRRWRALYTVWTWLVLSELHHKSLHAPRIFPTIPCERAAFDSRWCRWMLECAGESKKVTQKKVKIWPALKLLEKDIVVLSRHNRQMPQELRALLSKSASFFFFNELHQIHLNPVKIWRIHHLHLSCYLLASRCCLSSKGFVIWSTALWQLQLLSCAATSRENNRVGQRFEPSEKNAAAVAARKLIYERLLVWHLLSVWKRKMINKTKCFKRESLQVWLLQASCRNLW